MQSILRSRVCLLFLGLTIICVALLWRQLPATPSARPLASIPAPPPSSYGQVPLSFEANHGQANEPVKYLARGTNATLYLTPTEAALEVKGLRKGEREMRIADFGMRNDDHSPAPRVAQSALPNPQSAIVRMKLLGANPAPTLRGEAELPGKSNYFSGKDTKQWQTNIPTYARVKYEAVYDGIDLVYYGNQQQLEYDFVVQPGADPNIIRFGFEGVENVTLNAAGELVLQTAAGEVKQHKPVIYQEVNGQKQEIAGSYVLSDGQVGFVVGAYDASQPLVIDPVIVYATATGTNGVSGNGPSALAVDQAGCAYIGKSNGPAATPGAYENGTGLSVIKLNATGTAAIYSVTLSGGAQDWIQGMAVDREGNCYLTGQAASSSFVTTPGAFQTDYGITCTACRNAFVTKINPTGSALIYSTYLKGDDTVGSKSNVGQGIAVDAQGNAYVTGYTNAKDFPTTPGVFQPKLNTDNTSARDTFVTKLNANGTILVYSTYLGAGDNSDQGKNIAVDAAGNAYVTGVTGNGYNSLVNPIQKTPFPKTPGAYETPDTKSLGGIFLTKFNPSGSALLYSTIIGRGGTSNDLIGLVIDAVGNAYLASGTRSPDFPITPGAYKTTFTASGVGHAFVTKVNPTGSGLVYSTFVGGSQAEYAIELGIDSEGNATIAGLTDSPDFPQTGTPEATSNAFITKLNATGNALLYSGYYQFGRPERFVVNPTGDLYLLSGTNTNFQVTPGAYQTKGSPALVKISLPRSAVTVSAANYSSSPLASEAIVSAFGTGLAVSTQNAATLPLPMVLAGTTVKVKDSVGTEREAALFFASPTQVNFQLPAGTANGSARITITAQNGSTFVSNVEITNVAPAIFSADTTGRGLAAAQVQRGASVNFEPMIKVDSLTGQLVAVPIDLGPASEQVYLVLYGTGIRLRSSLSNVTVTMGGVTAQVSYAGTQNGFVGLDQVNILIPRSLIGRGMVDVVLNVDGKTANPVKVSLK